jgi:hypothetical protein
MYELTRADRYHCLDQRLLIAWSWDENAHIIGIGFGRYSPGTGRGHKSLSCWLKTKRSQHGWVYASTTSACIDQGPDILGLWCRLTIGLQSQKPRHAGIDNHIEHRPGLRRSSKREMGQFRLPFLS